MEKFNDPDQVTYHPKRDGVLRIDGWGLCRYLTLWERICYFFGGRP